MKSLLRHLGVLLLLSLVACVGRPQIASAPPPSAAARSPLSGLTFDDLEFQVPEVERLELPNGIRLYLKEDPELPLVEVTAMVEGGGVSVPAHQTGLEGLLATLLRTGGAGNLSPAEVDEALERMAANLSASSDAYAVTFGLSTRTQDLDGALAILADMIRRPVFDPQRLELARKQAIEAIRRQNDQPESIASRALMRAIYGDHPLGRTPTEETVRAVSRDDLQRFHRRFFHPGNLWLAVSGDFDRQRLLALLEKLFGDWSGGAHVRQEIPPVQPNTEPLVLVGVKEIPQTTILLGELGIDKSAPDLHAVRVMNYILGGGGFNSRLMREIRSNRGLAYSVYSYFQIGRRLPGPFVAGTETKSASTLAALELMREIIAGMREEPVSEAELKLARESLVNSFIFGFTDTHEVVTQQMRLDFYGYPEDYLRTYRDRIAEVTANDVLAAARARLHPDRVKIVLVGDASAFDGDPARLGLPLKTVTDRGEFR